MGVGLDLRSELCGRPVFKMGSLRMLRFLGLTTNTKDLSTSTLRAQDLIENSEISLKLGTDE